MKFFFAENCDTVDPGFDFLRDQTRVGRNRGRDLYAHEILKNPPYDGLLISRAVLDGALGGSRYSQAQRFKALREGIRSQFRYPWVDFSGDPFKYPIMGDCGAFSYIAEDLPPFTPEETLDFYQALDVQFGVAPDHIIAEHNLAWDRPRLLPARTRTRYEFTLSSARQFIELTRKRGVSMVPIGPIQCWSPKSAAECARKLVAYGYDYLGLGGLVARKTNQIYDLVSEIRTAIPDWIRLHLFGFTRIDDLETFAGLGIDSFDSTAPMLKAFKDDEFNYFSANGKHYMAIRVPPREDARLKQRIKSGQLNDEVVRIQEVSALDALRAYESGACELPAVLQEVLLYEQAIRPGVDLESAYRRTLADTPWRNCPCEVCQGVGIEVILHRSLNRHKRRGFHNLYILHEKLKKLRTMKTTTVPCLRIKQSDDRSIYSFAADGKDIQKFASISRIARTENGELEGYQRPEISRHIDDIRRYLEQSNAILPNALIIAFNKQLRFTAVEKGGNDCELGRLEIPVADEEKPGWIVDGQQRMAALRQMTGRRIMVPIIGIESRGIEDEREQFVLINNTRPLPKSLVYELLPSLGDSVPPRMRARQAAYNVLEVLASDPESPFFHRIKTTTSQHLPHANIKDVSILRMIENSVENGILARYPQTPRPQAKVLNQYWTAVKQVFPDAWHLPPRESRLTHGAGIISMGFLMDAIAFRLKQAGKNLNADSFRAELKPLVSSLAWTKGSWELAPGMSIPWKEIQNTGRHIDLVTNYLIRTYRSKVALHA